jgi:hypothetical protein
MRRGKRTVIRRMPILREHNVLKLRRNTVDGSNHFIATGDCQGATGAKIILHIDDEENVARINLHRDSFALNSAYSPIFAKYPSQIPDFSPESKSGPESSSYVLGENDFDTVAAQHLHVF